MTTMIIPLCRTVDFEPFYYSLQNTTITGSYIYTEQHKLPMRVWN